jgi:hypothetical protein
MRSAMRRMAVILALLSTGALLSACASASHHAVAGVTGHTARTVPHSGRAHGTPGIGGALSRTQALAYAHAVNLTATDVPGFKASVGHKRETPGERRREDELARCTGEAFHSGQGGLATGKGGLVAASSQDFKLERNLLDLSVNSEVSVAQTPALATKVLAEVRSRHFRACLTHYLDLLLKEHRYGGATVGPIAIAQGTPPAPGTTGSFGWRITATITARGFKLPFYQDMLGFVYGSAEVSLISSGALRPFPAAIQQQLFSLLLDRAKAHGGGV